MSRVNLKNAINLVLTTAAVVVFFVLLDITIPMEVWVMLIDSIVTAILFLWKRPNPSIPSEDEKEDPK
jgi:L-asparagine transporter-like permease